MKWKAVFTIGVVAGIALLASTIRNAYEPKPTITILGEDSSNLNAYSTLSEEFEKKFGIRVRIEKVLFDQLDEKADADFRSGTGKYDIVLNYNFALAPYVKNKYVVEMGSPTSPTPLRNVRANEGMFENALKETSFYYGIPDDPSSGPTQFGLPFAANTMLLAGVYKIAGVKARKAGKDAVLRRGLLYDLRSGRGVSLQVERAEQALLHIIHAG